MDKSCRRPEVWGGIECTINRLHSGYWDQLEFSGHYRREDDIDAIAELGIKTLRYPILWEKHQPNLNTDIDFSWVSERLEKLRDYHIKPVAGLLHHGSGPQFTNLLDPAFPELLASYARKVATRFPWIDRYTPVNEPLTTARFSGLYGHWFPHEKNDVSFAKMLLNQLKGTVLSMRAIREVNPNAILIQTEDLGKTYSTPLLHYQARMENHRRFLTYDLLFGHVTPDHPLYDHFIHLGIVPKELEFFTENPCPPEILGANYYCTSERYLDEDLSKYPESRHGGNTLHCYADVEAVRVKLDEPHGFEFLATQLWKRYQTPIAVTEAHLHCSREGQMKWFVEIYDTACKLKNSDIDIISVTAWSLLGSYGWNNLLTGDFVEYERGAFDVSSGNRRPTAMAAVLKTLVETGTYSNHVLHGQGWWKSESRFFNTENKTENTIAFANNSRPILISGKTGTLGQAFARICSSRSLHYVLLGRDKLDICIEGRIEAAIMKYKPWAIVNAAGYVRVDDAELEPERCRSENTMGAQNLAIACAKHEIQFLTFSSDLVFDGEKENPYVESDTPNPLNVYGQSKSDAEKCVTKALPSSLIIRTSAFFGPWDEYNFAHAVTDTLDRGDFFEATEDIISPTYVPHLVNAALDLLIDEEQGIWHLTNSTAISWFDFASEVALRAGFNQSLIRKCTSNPKARRPRFSALLSERGLSMPPLSVAISEYFADRPMVVQSRKS